MNSNLDIAKRLASSLNCTLSKEVLKTFAEILIPEKYKKGGIKKENEYLTKDRCAIHYTS